MSEKLTRESNIIDFNKAAGHSVNNCLNVMDLRQSLTLIKEEYLELQEVALECLHCLSNSRSLTKEQKVHLIKELGDLQYVVSRMAVVFGINLQEVFERIHKSNMSKVENGVTKDPVSGKILKGPNYVHPNLEDLIND